MKKLNFFQKKQKNTILKDKLNFWGKFFFLKRKKKEKQTKENQKKKIKKELKNLKTCKFEKKVKEIKKENNLSF